MDTSEASVLRDDLERDIRSLIHCFEKETGMKVDEVKLINTFEEAYGGGDIVTLSQVRTKISLI